MTFHEVIARKSLFLLRIILQYPSLLPKLESCQNTKKDKYDSLVLSTNKKGIFSKVQKYLGNKYAFELQLVVFIEKEKFCIMLDY